MRLSLSLSSVNASWPRISRTIAHLCDLPARDRFDRLVRQQGIQSQRTRFPIRRPLHSGRETIRPHHVRRPVVRRDVHTRRGKSRERELIMLVWRKPDWRHRAAPPTAPRSRCIALPEPGRNPAWPCYHCRHGSNGWQNRPDRNYRKSNPIQPVRTLMPAQDGRPIWLTELLERIDPELVPSTPIGPLTGHNWLSGAALRYRA